MFNLYSGGSIEVEITSDGKKDISGLDFKSLDSLIGEGGEGEIRASTKWYGGDKRFQKADQLGEWKESLGEKPQLLTTDIDYLYISQIVEMVSREFVISILSNIYVKICYSI